MQIQRHAEALQLGPYRSELRFVQVVPPHMVVVQHALEPELRHRPTQLHNRGLGVLQRKGGKAREPFRMCGDRLGEIVVDLPRGHHGLRGILDHFHARRGIREDLDIDPVGVHVRQPQLGQIVQATEPLLLDRPRHRHALTDRCLLPDGSGNGEGLFHGHDAHLFLLLGVSMALRAAGRGGGTAAGRRLGGEPGLPRDQTAAWRQSEGGLS